MYSKWQNYTRPAQHVPNIRTIQIAHGSHDFKSLKKRSPSSRVVRKGGLALRGVSILTFFRKSIGPQIGQHRLKTIVFNV